MNAEELSMIGPVVDLSSVDAIHRKRLVAFVNHFLINTASFLNRIARSCDSKLLQIQLRMQKLEASIILLETKLSSIPGLDTPVTVGPSPQVVETINEPEEKKKGLPEEEQVSQEENKVEKPELDPSLLPFVKMLHVGLPVPVVKLKMEQAGISNEQQNLVLN